MPRPVFLLSTLALAMVPTVQAATDDALAACRVVKDSAARLACYDALPIAPAPSPRSAPSPSAPRPAAAPAAPAAAPANEAARFGLPLTQAPAPIESIESRVDGHFDGWYPGTRIRLENGQVWQVTDGTSRFANVDRPKVTVKRGALGSFFLDIEGVNPAPRVRRVE